MALIVEDGSIVANANTYNTVADARTYADLRGIEMPVDDAAVEAMLIQSMDFFESYANKFIGDKKTNGQPLSWPRENVTLEGFEQPSDEIPRLVQYAQLAVAMEIAQGIDPYNPTEPKGAVTEERVEGAVTVKYANSGKLMPVSAYSKSSALIQALLKNGGLGLAGKAIRTIRV